MLAFILHVIIQVLISPRAILIYRFKVAMKTGFIPYLRQRFKCFNRKKKIETLTFKIENIPLRNIDIGHDVNISNHLIKRVGNLNKAIKEHLSLHDASKHMPSDEPIKLLKQGDQYIVVSGNGRTVSACMADLTTIEALVFENSNKENSGL